MLFATILTVGSVIQGLRDLLSRQADDQAQTFRDLAIRVADGKQVKPDAALATLTAAGKSPEDLQQAVEAIQARRVKHAAYLRRPAIAQELQTAKGQHAQAVAEREAAERQFVEKAWPLEQRIAELEAEERKAEGYREELCTTCDHPPLVARLAEAKKHEAERRKEENQAAGAAHRHHATPPEAQVRPLHRGWDGLGAESEELAAAKGRHLAEAERLDAELEKARAAVRKAEATVRAVEEEMVRWTI